MTVFSYGKKAMHTLRFCHSALQEMKSHSQVSKLLAQQLPFKKYYIPIYETWQHFHFLTKHLVKTSYECVNFPLGVSGAE